MKLIFYILGGLVVLAVLAYAALAPVKISSPAATGMNSNFDIQELKITDARFLQNARTDKSIGAIERRRGIKQVGDNNVKVYAAFGYFDASNRMKQVVAVADGRDSLITGYTADTTYYALDADTIAPYIRVSNRFESGVQDTTIKVAGFLGAPPYRSVLFDGAMAITSRGNIPLVYYPYGSTPIGSQALGYFHNNDTATYEPHVFSMGLEAPGQLRVGILNDSGVMFGVYRYAHTIDGDTNYSLPSRWVSSDSQKVYVTLFEPPPAISPEADGGDSTTAWKAILIRQKFGDIWYRLDTFTLKANQSAVYVDNQVDGFSYHAGTDTIANHIMTGEPNRIVYDTSVAAPPGGLSRYPDHDTIDLGSANMNCTGLCADRDSTYYVAYSYYDPISGIESPMGPIFAGAIVDSTWGTTPNDSSILAFVKQYTKINERAPWIRLYRGTSGDSLQWYGVHQLRANNLWPAPIRANQLHDRWTVYPGNRADSQIIAGTGNTPIWYRNNDFPLEEDGTGLIRPPYVEQLQIGYTDIVYANGRFWGIGDPLFLSRVYFSTYNDMFQWSAISFLSMNEDDADELVAIEVLPAENFDVIYVIKHNSCYQIVGYDPEFDVSWSQISSEVGAISRRGVVRYADAIYFLATDMKIYRLSNQGLKEISQPVENYIDTLFVDKETAAKTIIGFPLEDRVIWYDTAGERGLVYDTRQQMWLGIYQYDTDWHPIGTFTYDTLRSSFLGDEFNYYLYQSSTGQDFRVEYEVAIDSTATAHKFPFIYQTPFVGDGIWLYEIISCELLADWDIAAGAAMRIRIMDSEGTVVDSVSYKSDGRSTRLHRIGLPPNFGSYLGLQFQPQTGDANVVIHSVTMNYRKVARLALE